MGKTAEVFIFVGTKIAQGVAFAAALGLASEAAHRITELRLPPEVACHFDAEDPCGPIAVVPNK